MTAIAPLPAHKPAVVGANSSSAYSVAVLISGNGGNLQALIDAQAAGRLGCARIAHVISNQFAAYGIQRAQTACIAVHLHSLKAFCGGLKSTPAQRLAFDAELAAALNAMKPDLIVLAGWMHIFSPAFLDRIQAKVINLHPALPGAFAGAHAIDDAFAAFQAGQIAETGCMVHEVIAEVDAGRVLGSQRLALHPQDTAESIKQRMSVLEHALIVQVVRDLSLNLTSKNNVKKP